MTSELTQCSALALARMYAHAEASPVEATEAVLASIDDWNPRLNAFFLVDAAGALAAARASEERWRRGEPASPLDGVPVSVKDNVVVRGMPTPVGTAAGDPSTPAAHDSPPAARLREAGCVILGKTTMPDFGMLASGVSSLHGTTRNPWDVRRNTAGSSAGAGAAVAAGLGPLALGTDIGGSVRLPAAYCGIVGHKPSLGRVPVYPPFLGRVTGPMTRTVGDAAALLTVLARPDPRDFMSLPYEAIDYADGLEIDLKGLRVGLMLDIGTGLPIDPEVRSAVEAAARALADAGAIVTEAAPFATLAMTDGLDLFFRTRLAAEMMRLPAEREALVLGFIRTWYREAHRFSATEAMNATMQIFAIREAAVAATEPFDFLMTPTSPIAAYAAELPCPTDDPQQPFEHVAFTAPFNQSEQPACSVPCGFTSDGLPIGLQIVGHRFDDRGVLALAATYEALRGDLRPWPKA